IAANCICLDSVRHGAYVSCAVQEANATLVNKSCAGVVKRCASRSTCGKPGAVTCCVTKPNGTKCKIKRDAAHCPATAGACVGGYASCCDACTSTGCAPTSSTSTTTTTVPSGCIPTGTGVPCDIATSVCCPVPHGSVACTGNPSTCHLNLCVPGFGNCNNTAAD